jgi:hypothetical protein
MALVSTNKRVVGKGTNLNVSGDTLVEEYIVITDTDFEANTHALVVENNPDIPVKLQKHPEPEYDDLYVSSIAGSLQGGSRTHWKVVVTYSRGVSAVSPMQISTGTWILKKVVPRGEGYKLDPGSIIDQESFNNNWHNTNNFEDIANSAGDVFINPIVEEFPQPLLKYRYIIPASSEADFRVLEEFMALKASHEGRINDQPFTLLGQEWNSYAIKVARINCRILFQDGVEQISTIAPQDVFMEIEFEFEINSYSSEYMMAFTGEHNKKKNAEYVKLNMGHIRAVADVGYRELPKDENGEVTGSPKKIREEDKTSSRSPEWLDGSGSVLFIKNLEDKEFPYLLWKTIEDVDFEKFRAFGLPEYVGIEDDYTTNRETPQI